MRASKISRFVGADGVEPVGTGHARAMNVRSSSFSAKSQTLSPERVLRVMVCIEGLGVGGKERQAVELIKGLTGRTDVECRVVCLETHDFYLDQLAGLPVDFAKRRARWDMALFYQLYRAIRHYRPHVIHTNGLMSSFYTVPIARLMRIPLINGSIRNAFAARDIRWRMEKLLTKLSDYRVANSFAGLRSRGFAVDESRNVVIRNGFDFSRVEGLTSNECLGRDIPADRIKTVGMVAEFNRFKDYETFIQAARKSSGKRSDVVFLAVGNGETLETSKRMAAGVTTIKFLGERKNVEEIIATFDVGVLSTFTEGISNSIMEYMALRKPVVATDGGGTQEVVVHGETGFLVPARNPEALALKIEYLIDNPQIARRMGEAGEARLRREFSITRMIDETVKLYRLAVMHATDRSSWPWLDRG
jgi:glycosyltransferase involved in cell wall biosynthesis